MKREDYISDAKKSKIMYRTKNNGNNGNTIIRKEIRQHESDDI